LLLDDQLRALIYRCHYGDVNEPYMGRQD